MNWVQFKDPFNTGFRNSIQQIEPFGLVELTDSEKKCYLMPLSFKVLPTDILTDITIFIKIT